VGDEEDPLPQLAARHGLRDVVEGCGELEALDAGGPHTGSQALLPQLALHAAHDLEGVLEGIEVMVRALLDAP
jgi:hypothetical protein